MALTIALGTSDPCATAANPVQCHYQIGVALLAKLGVDTSGSEIGNAPLKSALPQVSLIESPQENHQRLPALQQSSVAPLSLAVQSEVPSSSRAAPDPDKEVAALQGALEVLEAPGPAGSGLEEDIDELEDSLEDVRPGAVSSFRAQRLADAINRAGPPAATAERAAEAFHFLDAVSWPAESRVPAVAEHLRRVMTPSKPKAMSLLQRFEDTVTSWGAKLHRFVDHGQRCARDVHEC